MTNLARKLADEVGNFLVVAEKLTKRERQERQLQRKMQKLFESAYAEAIRAVKEERRLAEPTRRRATSALGASTEKALGDLVWDHNRTALGITPTIAPRVKDHTFYATKAIVGRRKDRMEEILATSLQQGLSVNDAARLLQDEYIDLKDHKLRTIAQTEFTRTSNATQYETSLARGLQYHQWVAVLDAKTRSSHRQMHGQVAKVGARFSNGLRFPGDTSGRIEEWINCRCTLAPWFMPVGRFAGADWFYEDSLLVMKR